MVSNVCTSSCANIKYYFSANSALDHLTAAASMPSHPSFNRELRRRPYKWCKAFHTLAPIFVHHMNVPSNVYSNIRLTSIYIPRISFLQSFTEINEFTLSFPHIGGILNYFLFFFSFSRSHTLGQLQPGRASCCTLTFTFKLVSIERSAQDARSATGHLPADPTRAILVPLDSCSRVGVCGLKFAHSSLCQKKWESKHTAPEGVQETRPSNSFKGIVTSKTYLGLERQKYR